MTDYRVGFNLTADRIRKQALRQAGGVVQVRGLIRTDGTLGRLTSLNFRRFRLQIEIGGVVTEVDTGAPAGMTPVITTPARSTFVGNGQRVTIHCEDVFATADRIRWRRGTFFLGVEQAASENDTFICVGENGVVIGTGTNPTAREVAYRDQAVATDSELGAV